MFEIPMERIHFYQLPGILTGILTALLQLPDKRCLSHGMYLYQVMMTLHFSNDAANDAESTQKSKITSLSLVLRVKQWVTDK